MAVYRETIGSMSHDRIPSYINITPQVKEAVAKSGIKEGTVTVISPHTTCLVFSEEFAYDVTEDGIEYLQADLDYVLQKIVPNQTKPPPKGKYMYPGQAHSDAVAQQSGAEFYPPGGDKTQLLNGNIHLKATMLRSSQVLPVEEGKLGVGVTGYTYFVDFDRMRVRSRKCKIVVTGE